MNYLSQVWETHFQMILGMIKMYVYKWRGLQKKMNLKYFTIVRAVWLKIVELIKHKKGSLAKLQFTIFEPLVEDDVVV